MKNILKSAIFAFMLAALGACENDIEAVATNQAGPQLLTPVSGVELVLLEKNQDNVATTLVWDYTDFGVDAAATYTVEIAKAGTDFKTPIDAGTTAERFISWAVKDLNDLLVKKGFAPDVQSSIDIRVVAKLGNSTNALKQYSNVITLKVTPYTGVLPYDKTDWFLIGGAVQGGWDNNADTDHQPMFRDGANADKYSFIGYFLAGNFKLISVKGSWASQLGRASATAIEIKDNAGEWNIPTNGYYKFTFDTKALTYTLAPYDASAAKIYATIGMLGDATAGAWTTDTDMTKSTFDPHVWTVKIDLVKNGAKFRADNDWATSWGGDTAFSSIGSTGGNIPVTGKSKFIVYFSDIDGSYSMIPNQK